MNISAVIIVKNAARTLAQTLESLKEFDEVVVFDTGSGDESMDIARAYPNVKLCKGKFNGFGKSKNKAALLAKNDWILSIDADEVVSPQLMNSIRYLHLDNSCVYRLRRYNYYRKRRIRYSGWGLEYVTRIYNKTVTLFNENLVHEHINVSDLNVITLEGELRHFSYSSVSDFIQKRDFYSELFAREKMGKRKSSPLKAMFHAAYSFLYTFFLRVAFLDGYRGLLISVLNAHVSFYKYLKLYEANIRNDARVSLILLIENEDEDVVINLLKSIIYQTVAPDEIVVAINPEMTKINELIGDFAKRCFIPIHFRSQEDIFVFYEPNKPVFEMLKPEYYIIINDSGILHKNFVHDHIKYSKRGYCLSGANINLNLSADLSVQKGHNTFFEISSNKFNIHHLFFLIKYRTNHLLSRKNAVSKINISFFKQEIMNNNPKTEVISFKDIETDLLYRLEKIGIRRRTLHFQGIHYYGVNKQDPPVSETKKVLVCLDRLKHPNCGLGQVSINMGRNLIKVKQPGMKFSFLLPYNGFREFDSRIGTVRLNAFRHFSDNYMEDYDLCHVIHQLPSYKFGKSKKNLLTIHDLNFLFKRSDKKRQRYLRNLQNNIDKADAITFISEFTKKMCFKNLNIPEDKVTYVVHNGVVAPPNERVKPEWLKSEKFLFSIGQFLEKKNFHVLLPFLRLLPDNISLVVAGENETGYGRMMQNLVKEQLLTERVIMPGGISDNDRNYLYHHCAALLFPSVAEGFGLPVIEAMLCNKPVFCSNRTSLKEIGGDFAFFWKDFIPENMLRVYNSGMEEFNKAEYSKRQLEYASLFTYERNIQQYIGIYKQLIDNNIHTNQVIL